MNNSKSNPLDEALWDTLKKAVQYRDLATVFDIAKIIETRDYPEIDSIPENQPNPSIKKQTVEPDIEKDPWGNLTQYGWRDVLLNSVLPDYLFNHLGNARKSFTSHEFRLYIASTSIWQEQDHNITSKNTPSCKLSNGLTLLVNDGFLTRPSKYWYEVTDKFYNCYPQPNKTQAEIDFEQL